MSNTPLCRDYLAGRCQRDPCRFAHKDVCKFFYEHGHCKYGKDCAKSHDVPPRKTPRSSKPHRPKNTETFEPMSKPVDMRVVLDLHTDKLQTPLTTRDVLLVPNLFSDFAPGELYQRLVQEILHCGVPQEQLLKLWHGDTHLIADDHTPWKKQAPTFAMVIDRLRTFFSMDIKATRFNWYQDTSQWKPFHRDSSAIHADKAKIQNFTVGVSFGATRDVAFENMETKTVVSIPQPDGCVYCFAKDTNILWMHGILKEKETRSEGRISIIAWGWVDDQHSAS